MNGQYLRGIIHCHSHFSHDSVTPIRSYIRAAHLHRLDFIVLTDHDTTAGSLELRRAAAELMPQLCIPMAAEYSTDQGDVIVAFQSEEIRSRSYRDVVRAAREQSALILLPHPYVNHVEPQRQAAECDLIEVFNCRAASCKNAQAAALASELGCRTYVASDSHFGRSIANAILEVEQRKDLQDSLRYGQIRWAKPRRTPKWELEASQLVKAIRTHRPGLAAFRLASMMKETTRGCVSRLFPQEDD
jgi:predicted metal-dependent phosphoesterase TrpH